jgi:sterol desaturase/sphingolipid hydroxylase (fatty acid hydroxylase superfamily)
MNFNELVIADYPAILLTDFLRYFIVAGASWLLFYVLLRRSMVNRYIQGKLAKVSSMQREFMYSMSTVLIFSVIGLGVHALHDLGYTRIYSSIADYGWIWLFASIGISILFHDAYFYWTHRAMHHPKLFKHIHLVHHRSTNPSPWAAYSFHPYEAIIQALVLPILLFLIPMHHFAIVFFLIYMIVRNVVGHLGMEIMPSNFLRIPILNWHTTTVHHDLHHKDFHGNYGLYFTWWDRWMGTENSRYEEKFETVTKRKRYKQSRAPRLAGSKAIMMLLLVVLVTVLFG